MEATREVLGSVVTTEHQQRAGGMGDVHRDAINTDVLEDGAGMGAIGNVLQGVQS